LIVFIRCDVTGDGDVENILNLVELKEGTDASSIYDALRQSLKTAGLDDDCLQKNLISIATDGTSVLTVHVWCHYYSRFKSDLNFQS